MAETNKAPVGTILWQDLTVQNSEGVRDFYSQVVGWQANPQDMGDYFDFDMLAPDGQVVTGICHARGPNANLPAQWLIYIVVADVDESIERCLALGGKVVDGPRSMGGSRFCVIQDPAGAVAALID